MTINELISAPAGEKPLDRIACPGLCSVFRTLGCIGDSLSSGEFESLEDNGKKGYHDFFEYSWGQHIARNCGIKVYNFSRGGMTAAEYMNGFAQQQGFWEADKLCSAYIIALGVNDLFGMQRETGSVSDIDFDDYRSNASTFAGDYAKIIQRLKSMQPEAKFFLMAMPREGDERDCVRREHRDLLENMTRVFKNTYLIDFYTYAPVYDADFKRRFFLGGHMNPAGYAVTAQMVASYIDYIIRHNDEDFAQVGFIGTGYSY